MPTEDPRPQVRAAEVVLPCRDFAATLEFFTERLGFRVDAVSPADDPAVAVVSGHGLRVRLDSSHDGAAGVLRLLCDDPRDLGGGASELTAPNGTRICLAEAEPAVVLPACRPSVVITPAAGTDRWISGRAGMQYRDLIPDRQGGRVIASHIRIADAGPVPDYVHFHRVAFQMIFCHAGWVRLVYEDQGAPFVLHAGDCVLQPPTIRHRVLECSAGLEVVEIASPAEHETLADHDLALPTASHRPEREFDGQRFLRSEARDATWAPWNAEGFEVRDTGMADATRGVASAHVVRNAGADRVPLTRHPVDLLFTFVRQGSLTLQCEGHPPAELGVGGSFAIPAGTAYALIDCAPDLEFLQVGLPALA